MKTRLTIAFPYHTNDETVFEKLSKILQAARDPGKPLHTSSRKPVLVVNRDSIQRGNLDLFLAHADKRGFDPLEVCELLPVYSVDTCQMWLSGFGKVLDDNRAALDAPDDAILQLPGDLKDVEGDFDDFISQLNFLVLRLASADLVIGDFEITSYGAKALIDTYGTYPLVYNWFPTVGAQLRKYKIRRPRSEFFAATTGFLESFLQRRKFAYEQTLAFLIYAVTLPHFGEPPSGMWRVAKVDIGGVGDYGKDRGFREATDQVERAERMLKVLWRELNGGDGFNVDDFGELDRLSTAVRYAALVSFRNMLTAQSLINHVSTQQ